MTTPGLERGTNHNDTGRDGNDDDEGDEEENTMRQNQKKAQETLVSLGP